MTGQNVDKYLSKNVIVIQHPTSERENYVNFAE